jgi:hypothetical protein
LLLQDVLTAIVHSIMRDLEDRSITLLDHLIGKK